MRADSNPFSSRIRAVGRVSCGVLSLAIAGNALSVPGKRFVGQYDFGYAIRGDRAARLAQVFDDGSGKVFFEARANQPMPAVFAGKDLALLVLQPEGQYFTARTSASEFTLVLGGARAIVRRGEAALGDEVVVPLDEPAGRSLASAGQGLVGGIDYGAPGPSRYEHEQPVVFAPGSARLKPEVLEALTALVVRIGHGTPIRAVGRDDAGGADGADGLAILRAPALRNALLARGVRAEAVQMVADASPGAAMRGGASALRWSSLAPGREPASAPLLFDITPADHDIAGALGRWARAAGYAVEWDVAWTAPIQGEKRVEATSFPEAARQVAAGLRAQGYPVQAGTAADRVIRFTASE